MIRKAIGFLAAAMVLIVASSFAATVSVGVNGGVMKFTGDAGKGWKTGFMGGALVECQFHPMWAAGADFSYSRSKHEDDGQDAATLYPGLTGTIKDKFTLTNFGAHAKFLIPVQEAPVKPYLLGGLGFYNGKEKFETDGYTEETKTNTKFGFRGGAGAKWMANEKIGVGVEGSYHVIQTEGESIKFWNAVLGVSFVIPTNK